MTFQYYWDRDLFEALLRYRMRPFLANILAAYEGRPMATAADIQKLIDGMKRAKALTERAAADAPKHAAIMDNFEHRLNLNAENMAKINEYEKLMAAMDQSNGNGGPALEATFPSNPESPPSVAAPGVTPLPDPPAIHRDTGDPVK
jgi:hypothetical protein